MATIYQGKNFLSIKKLGQKLALPYPSVMWGSRNLQVALFAGQGLRLLPVGMELPHRDV